MAAILQTIRVHLRNAAVRPFSSKVYSENPRLHFHPSPNAPRPDLRYALSFLSSKDLPNETALAKHNELIIGWTPDDSTVDAKTFLDNAKFVDFMTDVLRENVHKLNDTTLQSLAKWQKEGWMHIGDERNPPPWGRIPFPEDIVGSVLVKDGIIQPHSYQPMPAHRLVTANGVFQLSAPLTDCLVEAAKNRIKE